LTRASPIMTSPPSTLSSPAMIRSSVLLPQPEGPTKTTNSRSGISRLSCGMTTCSLNFFTTLLRRIDAMAGS